MRSKILIGERKRVVIIYNKNQKEGGQTSYIRWLFKLWYERIPVWVKLKHIINNKWRQNLYNTNNHRTTLHINAGIYTYIQRTSKTSTEATSSYTASTTTQRCPYTKNHKEEDNQSHITQWINTYSRNYWN